MAKRTPGLIIFSSIIIVVMLFSSACCPLIKSDWNPSKESGEETEILQEVDEFIEKDKPDSVETEGISETGEAGEEQEYYSFAEVLNNPLFSSLDQVLDTILLASLPEERENIVFWEEQEGDNIFGIPDVVPEGHDPAVDIVAAGHFILSFPPDFEGPPMDVRIPCGMWGRDPSVRVLCDGENNSEEIQNWFVFFMIMKDTIPMEGDSRQRTVAVTLESDQNPDNDFVPYAGAENDFFQSTDTWYQLKISSEFRWSFEVYASDGKELNSGARALVYNNTFAVFVPEYEISADKPGWRGAGDSNADTYDPKDYFGNVTFSDPKRKPELVDSSSSIHVYQYSDVETYWIRGGYEWCQWGGCMYFIDQTIMGDPSDTIHCECGACGIGDELCKCSLFASLKWGWGNDDIPGVKYWDYAVESDAKYKKDPRYTYVCFCAKESK